MRPVFLLLVSFYLTFSGVQVQTATAQGKQSAIPELSATAEAYILSVVDIMKGQALHRAEINFESLLDSMMYYADGAQTIEDTHQAIEKALPLLLDHHSYFLSLAELKQSLGLDEKGIETLKNGKLPNIASSKIDSLRNALNYATGEKLNDNIGYLAVPGFGDLLSEAVSMFADSLQNLIGQLDQPDIAG